MRANERGGAPDSLRSRRTRFLTRGRRRPLRNEGDSTGRRSVSPPHRELVQVTHFPEGWRLLTSSPAPPWTAKPVTQTADTLLTHLTQFVTDSPSATAPRRCRARRHPLDGLPGLDTPLSVPSRRSRLPGGGGRADGKPVAISATATSRKLLILRAMLYSETGGVHGRAPTNPEPGEMPSTPRSRSVHVRPGLSLQLLPIGRARLASPPVSRGWPCRYEGVR